MGKWYRFTFKLKFMSFIESFNNYHSVIGIL